MIRSPLRFSALTLPRPHWCGSHGRSQTAPRIGETLYEKRAARLRHVLAGHVHREHLTCLAAFSRVGSDPGLTPLTGPVRPGSDPNLCSHCRLPAISVMKRKVSVRDGGDVLLESPRQGDSHLGSGWRRCSRCRCAGLLHVRSDHDPLVWRDPAGNLRDERAHGRGGEGARNGDADRRSRLRRRWTSTRVGAARRARAP